MDSINKRIIMVVDDSLLICEQIKSAMKEAPFFVCEAHTGQEAIEVAKQYQPDLILLDVVLPDTDGYELFGKLKAVDNNDAVIIFLTSKDKDEDVVRGFSMGACDYIKKPFVKSELFSRVQIHLQLKAQKDELSRQNQELRSNMEKLNQMAFRDGLTGLYNRRYVVGDLMDDIHNHKTVENTEEKKNVLILADIDDFKVINDTYGHDVGDMALVCISNVMESVCDSNKVVRWGGEEFLMVLFHVTEDEAYAISEKVRRDVESLKMYYPEGEFGCTITLGLQVYEEQKGMEENINRADKALYKGKRSGKNCSVWYKDIQ